MKINLSENARLILEQRYLQRDKAGELIETPEELFTRVSSVVAQGEQKTKDMKYWKNQFYELLTSLRFLPNSPTMVNAGTDKGCLSACFVVSPEDDMNSIMDVAHDAAMIEKWGGGIGFGFSKLRPVNDKIATTHGKACGPIAVMKLYSSVGSTLTQGAFRLGAHMGQLRIDHPDIREFIHCKDNDDTLQNFNISVQITDDFMNAVRSNEDWNLINPRNGEVVETVRAVDLWNEICESAWKTGDPGVVFIDRVWETAPNPQLGKIESSNPCGEEMLENYGNCCLGSINLDAHVNKDGTFNWNQLENTVRTAVRFLDNVIEVNTFPLEKLRDVNLRTRRIGLGVMGFADMLVRLGMSYDSDDALSFTEELGRFINETAWNASEELAIERGPFPEYENSALAKTMNPVRNSSVVTIAPTGTISRLADCSSGIEPHFAMAWRSNVLWKDHEGTSTQLIDAPVSIKETLKNALKSDEKVQEMLELLIENPGSAYNELREYGINPDIYRTAMDISPESHVKMQAFWQRWATNSVSKTINLPNDANIEDVRNAYELSYDLKCKAVTVYRDGSKSMQVLETGKISDTKEESADRILEPRPVAVEGITEYVKTGHGNMYVNVGFNEENKPFELFTTLGRAGGCDSANLEAIARLASMSLRSGIPAENIIDQLKGITCCPIWDSGTLVKSVPDAMAHVLNHQISPGDNKKNVSSVGIPCPECDEYLIPQEGCFSCLSCGYSKCE